MKLPNHVAAARYGTLALIGIGIFWCVIRFIGLENAPYGIWMDESRVALHTACILETGRPAGSQLWPFFAPAFGDGHHPFTLLYVDAAWTWIFGNSIAAFRAVSAVAILATVAGLVAIARRIGSPLLAIFVFVSAALSPWSFQFSRIAWEGPLAPAFMVWSVYALLLPQRWHISALAGLLGGLAMITYPPLRATTPLVLLGVGLLQLRARKLTLRDGLIAAAALLITLLPVIVLTAQGKLSGRTMSVAIFSADYLDSQRGQMSRWMFFCSRFLDNLLSHFRASYLFFTGDENKRHSPGIVGQLSPIDALGFVALLGCLLWHHYKGESKGAHGGAGSPGEQRSLGLGMVWLGVIGFVLGSIPSALTWDTVPHSLRSIGAWPWACLASGAALAWWVQRQPKAVLLIAAVAAAYSVVYLPKYFVAYREAPVDDFRRDLKQAIDSRGQASAAEAVQPFLGRYSDEELRYYLIRWDKATCRQSHGLMDELRSR